MRLLIKYYKNLILNYSLTQTIRWYYIIELKYFLKMVKISFKIPSNQQPLTLDVNIAETTNIQKLKIKLGQ